MITIKLKTRTLGVTFKHLMLPPFLLRSFQLDETPGKSKVWSKVKTTYAELYELPPPDEAGVYPEPKLVSVGAAQCAPQDSFKKETGRKRALASALKIGNIEKPEREEFWGLFLAPPTPVTPAPLEESHDAHHDNENHDESTGTFI